jgi:threonine dehydratase
MRQSLDAGAPVRLERIATAADGLAAPFIGEHTFAHATALVDDILLVTDDEILHTMRTLMERVKVMAEPAGAAALAALLAGRVPATAGATIAVVVSGGNVDLGRLRDML